MILFVAMAVALVSTGVYANTNSSNENEKSYIEYCEVFLRQFGENYQVDNMTLLHNLEGISEFALFDISSGGYIILDVNDYTVPEFSLTNSNPYADKDAKLFYNGPLTYMQMEDDEIINVRTKEKIKDNKEIGLIYTKEKMSTKEKDAKKNKLEEYNSASSSTLSNTVSTSASSTYTKLSRSLKTWYKDGGYCGSIAASYFLYYLDYWEDSLVDSSDEDSGLIDVLIPLIDGDDPGSSTNDLRDGLNDYLDAQAVDTWYFTKKTSFSWSKIKSQINRNYPVIVDTDNHPEYDEHWITVHGYYDGSFDYLLINDGWGSNNVWIDKDTSYLDDLVYCVGDY